MGIWSDLADFGRDIFPDDLGDLADLVGTGFEIYEAFEGPETPSGFRQDLGRGSQIAAALADPEHPLFKRVVAQEESTIARDYAEALRQVGVENQRQMARTGGMGILDPERRDEALAHAASRSYVEQKRMARDQARAYLASAAGVNNAQLGRYGPLFTNEERARSDQISGVNATVDLIKNFAGRGASPDGADPSRVDLNLRLPPGYTPGGLSFGNNVLLNPPGLSFNYGASAPRTYTTPRSYGEGYRTPGGL